MSFGMLTPFVLVGAWILIPRLLALMGGWSLLAKNWANPVRPLTELQLSRFSSASATVGGVPYRGLSLEFYPSYLRLEVGFVLRNGHPVLQIPRHSIEGGKYKSARSGSTTYDLKAGHVAVQFQGDAAIKVKEWVEKSK